MVKYSSQNANTFLQYHEVIHFFLRGVFGDVIQEVVFGLHQLLTTYSFLRFVHMK